MGEQKYHYSGSEGGYFHDAVLIHTERWAKKNNIVVLNKWK